MKSWPLLLVLLIIGSSLAENRADLRMINRLAQKAKRLDIPCDICLIVMELVEYLLVTNSSESTAAYEIKRVCPLLKNQNIPQNVCYGAIDEFAPEVWPILVTIDFEPKRICNYLGFCNSKQKFDFSVQGHPHIELPAETRHTKRQNNLYIAQLSDIHYDELYTVGANAVCDEPLCCRAHNGFNGTKKARKWGEYECDLTLPMLESLLSTLGSMKPDIIVWTGDTTAHDVWEESPSLQINRLIFVSQLIAKYFPSTPVFPIMGNHDTFPVDQWNRKPKDFSHYDDFEWLVDGLASVWGKWITPEGVKTLKSGGYYTALVRPGLRIVGLNTAFGDNLNFYLMLNEDQQQPQFDWLYNTLLQAETQKEKVLLLGHIPTGDTLPAAYRDYARKFVTLVTRFKDTLVGQFFGHTHNDQFELEFDNATNAVSGIAFIAPSATTYTHRNPAFRIYEYSPEYTLLDYHQYFTNLTLANEKNSPQWVLEYSAKSAYNLSDMSAASWLDLVHRFQKDDALFQKWWSYFHALYPSGSCTGDCKTGDRKSVV